MRVSYSKTYIKNDTYPEMTKKAVEKLWNDEKYTREGLLNIAYYLMECAKEGSLTLPPSKK